MSKNLGCVGKAGAEAAAAAAFGFFSFLTGCLAAGFVAASLGLRLNLLAGFVFVFFLAAVAGDWLAGAEVFVSVLLTTGATWAESDMFNLEERIF